MSNGLLKADAGVYVNLFNECPELKDFYDRTRAIVEMKRKAEQEQDLKVKVNDLNLVISLIERLYAEMVEHISKTSNENIKLADENVRLTNVHVNEYEKLCQELKDALTQEREENKEFFYGLCRDIINKPRVVVETMLNFTERELKIDGDGEGNWSWTLKFSPKARLLMAWRLIFG